MRQGLTFDKYRWPAGDSVARVLIKYWWRMPACSDPVSTDGHGQRIVQSELDDRSAPAGGPSDDSRAVGAPGEFARIAVGVLGVDVLRHHQMVGYREYVIAEGLGRFGDGPYGVRFRERAAKWCAESELHESGLADWPAA